VTAVVIHPPRYRSPEWHAWRRGGLGASDFPAIVGCPDAYVTEYQLYVEKRATEAPEDAPSDVMRIGSFLEDYALMRWEERTGLSLVTGETWMDPRWPNLWATLDGRVPERNLGVEAKYQSRGGDDLPERFVVQALVQIGLAGLDGVDVVRLSPRGDITVHRVERDEARVIALLDLGQAWYERHVLGDEPPPLDGSPEARRALDRMVGSEQREADERQRDLLADLRRTRSALERLTKAEESLVRDIKASMAGAGALIAPGLARVTWSPVKGRRTTDWKAVASDAGASPELIETHTRVGDPTTRFAVEFEEDGE
jgi:predicted phage-related endonuclease